MVSLLVAAVVLVALLVLGLASRESSGPYPDRVVYGALVIPFSTLDRVCYLVAVVSLAVGVMAGVALIWGPERGGVLGKVAGTAGLLFAGSLLALMLNRLTRGRSGP